MPQGSDPRRGPDQQSPDPGSSTQPGWWASLWEERLPREQGEPRPKLQIGSLFGRWGSRMVMALIPLLVVAAVLVGSFGLTSIAEAMGGAILLLLAGAALEPFWRRAKRSSPERWR